MSVNLEVEDDVGRLKSQAFINVDHPFEKSPLHCQLIETPGSLRRIWGQLRVLYAALGRWSWQFRNYAGTFDVGAVCDASSS